MMRTSGEVMSLVGTLDTHLAGLGQLRATRAVPAGAVRYVLIGQPHPRQRAARRAPLLAPIAP